MNERYQRLLTALAIGNLALIILVVTLVWGGNIALAIGLRAPDASQNIAETMSYQGFLADDGGNPINGQRDMVFRIYDVAEGGIALWEETHTGVPIGEGVFNVQLGSRGSALTSDLFSEASRWIEIEVASVVLAPRQPLGSVPYAFNAARLNGQTAEELLGNAGSLPGGAVVWFRDGVTPTGYTKIDALGLDIGMWEPINVPTGISVRNCSIWTGSQVLCPGDTGASYDPSTDTWTPITTTNAPTTTRYVGFSAIWTGSDMIIWGGDYVNTGARYHLANDTWHPVTTTNAPEGRRYHRAVWTGSEMVVWGGQTESGNTNTGARYNPITDSWMPITTTGAPSSQTSINLIWSGSQIIAWGSGGDGALYDPGTDTWTAMNMTGWAFSSSALWTGVEMVVPDSFRLNFYNPDTDTWRAVFANHPYPAAGGWGVLAENLLLTPGGWYDLSQDRWLALANRFIPGSSAILWTGDNVLNFYPAGSTPLKYTMDLIYPYTKD